MAIDNDGAIEFGLPPENYLRVIAGFGGFDPARVLAGKVAASGEGWSPYHAWLLTHFFFFGDIPPQRREQFVHYMAAVAQGQPLERAAAAFGDPAQLERDVLRYGAGRTKYRVVPYPAGRGGEPTISQLTHSDAAVLQARLELDARLDVPDGKERAGALAGRDRFLDKLRRDVAQMPYNRDALLLLAEAECRTGQAQACRAKADAVLARDSGDAEAAAWRGLAGIATAATVPAVEQAAFAAQARAQIAAAVTQNSHAIVPQAAYFRSFTDVGLAVPATVQLGMLKVIRQVPAAPAPRLMLGQELARQGQPDAAAKLLLPVVRGGYASPEQAQAIRAGLAGRGLAGPGRGSR